MKKITVTKLMKLNKWIKTREQAKKIISEIKKQEGKCFSIQLYY